MMKVLTLNDFKLQKAPEFSGVFLVIINCFVKSDC